MTILTSLFYFVRKIWFSVFPRKVGLKGWTPTEKTRLGAVGSLPAAPATWASPRMTWGMLGNDTYGDCVVAGICHAIMAVGKFVGQSYSFTATQAAAAYFAMTGGADSGLNPPGVFEEWEANTDPAEVKAIWPHSGPFVSLDPTNIEQLKSAIATFGWVGVGSNLQQAQEDQFSKGQKWDYVPGSPVVGGHFVVLTGFDKYGVGPYTLSWAKGFRATWAWVTNTCPEAYTGVLPPVLTAGKYVAPVATLDAYCSKLPGA